MTGGLKFEVVQPSPIPNTTVTKVYQDGEHKGYQVCANVGYMLHDKILGYTRSSIFCEISDSFMPKFIDIDGGFVGYGMREIWCKPIG